MCITIKFCCFFTLLLSLKGALSVTLVCPYIHPKIGFCSLAKVCLNQMLCNLTCVCLLQQNTDEVVFWWCHFYCTGIMHHGHISPFIFYPFHAPFLAFVVFTPLKSPFSLYIIVFNYHVPLVYFRISLTQLL